MGNFFDFFVGKNYFRCESADTNPRWGDSVSFVEDSCEICGVGESGFCGYIFYAESCSFKKNLCFAGPYSKNIVPEVQAHFFFEDP